MTDNSTLNETTPFCQSDLCFTNLGEAFCQSPFCTEDLMENFLGIDETANETNATNATNTTKPEPEPLYCETIECSVKWNGEFCASQNCQKCQEGCNLNSYMDWQLSFCESECLLVNSKDQCEAYGCRYPEEEVVKEEEAEEDDQNYPCGTQECYDAYGQQYCDSDRCYEFEKILNGTDSAESVITDQVTEQVDTQLEGFC